MKRVVLILISIFIAVSSATEDILCQLIQNNGYFCETHHVVTADGYILTLHRIPNGKNSNNSSSKAVFLQHGLLASSAFFVITGPERGLGYLLADEGYDVWMGNTRGNSFSRNHTDLNPDDPDFWNFEWHQKGVSDLPAMIDYTLKVTQQTDLFYIGHSEGTTIFYVMASILPDYNNKIKAHFGMAPMAYMSHIASPFFKFIAQWSVDDLDFLMQLIGQNEFLFSPQLLTMLNCNEDTVKDTYCNNSLIVIAGLPRELKDEWLEWFPAGASVKEILHYCQEIVSGYFRQYDFGLTNLDVYGTKSPPDYDLNAITTSVYFHYSQNDDLSSEIDVDKLCNELGNCSGKFLVGDTYFFHLDYIFSPQVKELVYDKIINIMATHNVST